MKRLQSGKFWMKLISGGTLLFVLAFAVKHILLSWLFSPENLRRAADEAVAGTGRRVRFVENGVSAAIFPRPTVTLKQVELTQPGGAGTQMRAEEMRVGIGWASLFGEPRIEKWVFVRPVVSLARDAAGEWNVRDLLAKQNGAAVDRIIVEDGRVLIDTPQHRHVLEGVGLNINNADDEQTQIKADGRLKTPLWENEAQWKLQGVLHRSSGSWQMPEMALTGSSRYRDAELAFRFTADTLWQRRSNNIRFTQAGLQLDIPAYKLHLNAEAPALNAADGRLSARSANAVLTAQWDDAQWDATLSAKDIALRPGSLAVEQALLNGSRKTAATQTAFTLDTAVNRSGADWVLPALKLTTRLDNLTGNPRPRLVSELDGSWTYRNGSWEGRLKGQLDREALALKAAYTPAVGKQPARLNADLRLDKLSLSPYLESLPADSAAAYPAWLQKPGAPEIEADIAVKTLQSPNLEINNLTTRLQADRERIVLPDFSAELYNGVMEGGISMAATTPPTYRLQQYARNINIRPLMQDLFRYGNISGRGDAEIDLTAQGTGRAGLTRTLSGTLELNLSKGAWHGVNLNRALQNLLGSQAVQTDGNSATPFERFTMSSSIGKGISRHDKAELYSDTFRIELTGATDFNTMTLNERLKLYPAGGQGTPVPLIIRGKPDNLSVTLDYKGLTEGLASAEEKQQALERAIREQWQWLNNAKPAAPPANAKP